MEKNKVPTSVVPGKFWDQDQLAKYARNIIRLYAEDPYAHYNCYGFVSEGCGGGSYYEMDQPSHFDEEETRVEFFQFIVRPEFFATTEDLVKDLLADEDLPADDEELYAEAEHLFDLPCYYFFEDKAELEQFLEDEADEEI